MALPLVAVPLRDVLEKAVKLLEKILEKLGRIEGAVAPAVPPEVAAPPVVVTLTIEEPDENYAVFPIDLTVAHTDEPLGLKKSNIVGRNLDIHKAESPYTIKLNSKSDSPIDCEKGLNISNFRTTEIFYSNAAATGEGKIFVSWR